ncbi:hypothetical protein [Synechococcus sp. Cu2B8-bc1011]|uniref:hypothetical protein n=1 Tax=Synechococcus sp. Cu2B8-bc1011 TaxID=3093725 RepID=UPI0039B0E40F
MAGDGACKKETEHRPVPSKAKENPSNLDSTECTYTEATKTRIEKTKRTKSLSIELTGEMHKILKTVAVKNDDTLNSLVVEALKQFLENEERLNIKAEKLRKRLL